MMMTLEITLSLGWEQIKLPLKVIEIFVGCTITSLRKCVKVLRNKTMRRLIFIFICLFFFCSSYGQKKSYTEDAKIKRTILKFLNWHKVDQNADSTNKINSGRLYLPIIVWKQIDTMTKVSINMFGVEADLDHLRSSKVMSETFLNNLRQYYQKIADELEQWTPFPTRNGIFAIPGLNCDVIFGCEPEEILDHIKEGKFTRSYHVYNKAIVKFDISKFSEYIFTLTKRDGIWLIDSFGFDGTHFENRRKGQRP
jgi:hypothetical protein